MLRFMIQKLVHKKWMFISLLIGNILLITITCSYPMYKNASLQRMLTDNFTNYLVKENQYPALVRIYGDIDSGKSTDEYEEKHKLSESISTSLMVTEKETLAYYHIMESKAVSLMGRDDKKESQLIKVSSLSDIENHINMVAGSIYSNQIKEDGIIEAVVSKRAFAELNLLMGEEFEFPELIDANGYPIKLRITGVFENNKVQDYYWVRTPNSFTNDFFIAEDIFKNKFIQYDNPKFDIVANWFVLIDYAAIRPKQIPDLIANTLDIIGDSASLYSSESSSNYLQTLKDYQLSEKKISATLMILQVPILCLLCSFIFMISGQMLEMEQNEISLLKSRGAGKYQIITIYLLQSIFIALISVFLGIPLGSILCRALGSTSAFLEFVQRRALNVKIDLEVLLYALGAVIISVCVMVLPVFKHANLSIVNYKQKKNRGIRKIWQKLYLDIVLLGISLYALYSFREQKDYLIARVLSGSPQDPFLYLSSSIFIISLCLIGLRFQPLLVKVIFSIGKKKWKPASYASFLHIIRTGSKQNHIMVFLMFTIALGIFNATIARTILSNADNNEKYMIGADIVLSEIWPNNYNPEDPSLEVIYTEPSFDKYKNLKEVSSVTKVIVNDNAYAITDYGVLKTKVMGIHTKEFGETAWFKENLLPYHYYEYLNLLAGNADGILVSTNFAMHYGYEVGDIIRYKNNKNITILGVIHGFIDYWPTYQPISMSMDTSGSLDIKPNYLIVSHFANLQDKWGLSPYQVWMDVKDKTDFIYDFTMDNSLKYTTFFDINENLKEIRNNTMFQGTNGILTMSFIIILILSVTGFLIYWILSIRSRELLFGVLRAMGMSKREVIHILINEQIFSTGLSLVFGVFIGIVASKLYIPLIQITYMTTDRFLPLELITKVNDLVRLFIIILLAIIFCMFILSKILSKIKISQALKLGEEM